MNTLAAFAMGQANSHREQKVFDWDQAARILKERGAVNASAGLQSDLDWTAGEILRAGLPDMEGYTFLSSTWATPVLIIDGDEIDCYRMASEVPDWGSDTKWPQSALDIFNAK